MKMICITCQHDNCKKNGRDHLGQQRFKCQSCNKTFIDKETRPLLHMRIDPKQAEMCLNMLLEGMSINATSRMTGVAKNTILDLIETAADQCEKVWDRHMVSLEVSDVECDEIWSFVGMKEKTRERLGADNEFGDAYVFTALDGKTKLIITWHLGKRSSSDTHQFTRKLSNATTGGFQINTDGYGPYKTAIPATFGSRVDHASIVKVYNSPTPEDQRKYSPARIAGTEKTASSGNPDLERASTSYVERHNRTIRMAVRRFTRLTDAHSKLWRNHEAMLKVFFCWYNFCRPHMTLKGNTPAMATGLTDRRWSISDLLKEASTITVN